MPTADSFSRLYLRVRKGVHFQREHFRAMQKKSQGVRLAPALTIACATACPHLRIELLRQVDTCDAAGERKTSSLAAVETVA
jgi:hypothetical protein